MAGRGVILHPDCTIASVVAGLAGFEIRTLSDGIIIDVDQVMAATARLPNTAGLGLEAAGMTLGPKGEIAVDANSQTRWRRFTLLVTSRTGWR